MRKQITKLRVEHSWLNNWLMWASIEMTHAEGSLSNALDRAMKISELENTLDIAQTKVKILDVRNKMLELHEIIKSVRSEIPENMKM